MAGNKADFYKSESDFMLIVFQASYVKNLLQISKYLPNLRSKVLEVVIDNLIKIDVSTCNHWLVMQTLP